MDHRLIIVAIVLAGVAVTLFLPQSSYECTVNPDVICLDRAEDLPDDGAAHQAVARFVRKEFGTAVPPLEAFRSGDRPEYSLAVEGTTYTFANHAASPQWSVTVAKQSVSRWQIVKHSRFVTEAE